MGLYVRLVAATSRVTGEVTQEPVVLAFWHEYNLVAAVAAQRRRRHRYHVSFSTQTLRGAVMDAMLVSLDSGSVPLPAPEDRAGSARLSLELARLGLEGASPGVSPDGPLGPYRRAKPGALLVALVKPQFEAGRAEVGKGGVVRDPEVHQRVCAEASAWVESQGWSVVGVTESPITGPEGNKEFLLGAIKDD